MTLAKIAKAAKAAKEDRGKEKLDLALRSSHDLKTKLSAVELAELDQKQQTSGVKCHV